MTTLKYKKIYIDTKYKTPDSKSTSDFKVELPETVYFENNSVFYIDDIAIPHSWFTVEDFNNKLYLYLYDVNLPSVGFSYIVTLANGNYTGLDFAAEVHSKINAATSNSFTCTYNSKTNSITIATAYSSHAFVVLTPDDLKTALFGKFNAPYNKSKPNDCNEILSSFEGSGNVSDVNNPFRSGYLNMQPIRNLYLHSTTLGNLNSVSCDGSQTVIKKIPVTSDYNQMIFDQCVLYNDYNDCSQQTLKTLEFQLKTSRGDIVPLHGVNILFSIALSRANPDL